MPAIVRQENAETGVPFPEDPFFSKLLAAAERRGKTTIIHEKADGVKANYNQLLHDVHELRKELQSRLGDELLNPKGMVKQDGFYIAILTQGGYKFLVACIAIIAIGAAVIPLSQYN